MQDLVTYLENIVSLEKNVYTQTQMIEKLDYEISQLGLVRRISVKEVKKESAGDKFG